ncbi:hypothetical protein BC628DRAFT_1486999 [Trametes gibbosa]|nr:hypothetical protein BC628DRAFT_1486999 [Trametes gibbosa]
MNRHHPYGGPYDGPRRGGPPGGYGPGPDRSHRFERGGGPRGRGFGRGRGGGHSSYGGYGNAAQHDQGPPQGPIGGYNNYQSMPPQDPFYQNGNYAAPGPGQYNAPDPNGSFDQDYSFEDGTDQNYTQGGGYGRFQQKKPQRRERDDKVHDSIIEERLQRERPCRTLFIRNIKYETNSDDVRRLFEEHGEIKTFFDLIANRGMVFVTYFDLRAAERARDRLQGSEISGRPIDVHYSLPRDDNGKGADRQREQELQGTLLVTLRNSPTNQPIDDGEVRRKFQQFGDVKSVRPVADRPDQHYVEFYDTRASEEAHDRLRHQGLQDGVMEIVYAVSGTDDPRGGGGSPSRERSEHGGFERQREWEEPPTRGRRGGRGGRGRGRGYGGDDWGERRDWNRDRNRSNEDEFGRTTRGGDFSTRGGHRNGPGGYGGGSSSSYGAQTPSYGQAREEPAEAADERERLEQAKKVQQLLAALKQPQSVSTSTAPPAAPMPPAPAPSATPYYGQPSLNMPSQPPTYTTNPTPAPPANPYASMVPQAPAPQPVQSAPTVSFAGLPANILALLQQGSQAQQQPVQTGAPPPPMPPYSMPPASAMIGAQQSHQQTPPGMPLSNPAQPGYQQLMAYLQSQKR